MYSNITEIDVLFGNNVVKKGEVVYQQGKLFSLDIDAGFTTGSASCTGSNIGESYLLTFQIDKVTKKVDAVCSCPAGMRANGLCKHMAAVFLARIEMMSSKDLQGSTGEKAAQVLESELSSEVIETSTVQISESGIKPSSVSTSGRVLPSWMQPEEQKGKKGRGAKKKSLDLETVGNSEGNEKPEAPKKRRVSRAKTGDQTLATAMKRLRSRRGKQVVVEEEEEGVENFEGRIDELEGNFDDDGTNLTSSVKRGTERRKKVGEERTDLRLTEGDLLELAEQHDRGGDEAGQPPRESSENRGEDEPSTKGTFSLRDWSTPQPLPEAETQNDRPGTSETILRGATEEEKVEDMFSLFVPSKTRQKTPPRESQDLRSSAEKGGSGGPSLQQSADSSAKPPLSQGGPLSVLQGVAVKPKRKRRVSDMLSM